LHYPRAGPNKHQKTGRDENAPRIGAKRNLQTRFLNVSKANRQDREEGRAIRVQNQGVCDETKKKSGRKKKHVTGATEKCPSKKFGVS